MMSCRKRFPPGIDLTIANEMECVLHDMLDRFTSTRERDLDTSTVLWREQRRKAGSISSKEFKGMPKIRKEVTINPAAIGQRIRELRGFKHDSG